jgi:mono/diheme cytochrome c family protein
MHRPAPFLALALALAPAACDASSAPVGAPDGRALFRRQTCTVCHGVDGAGSALAPALRGLRANWSVQELALYLADPAAYAAGDERLRAQAGKYPQMMPKYGTLDAAQREALAAYVLELAD